MAIEQVIPLTAPPTRRELRELSKTLGRDSYEEIVRFSSATSAEKFGGGIFGGS